MKSLKLLASVATACLLVGASSAAMAVGCLTGSIEDVTVDEIIIDGRSCFIHDVIVQGNIDVRNTEEITIVDSEVGGSVLLRSNRFASMLGTNVTGNILTRRNERVQLALNIAQGIWVGANRKAVIKRNVGRIAIVCQNNDRLDAFENEAPEMRCRSLGGGLGPF